jgi:hypothetical protein
MLHGREFGLPDWILMLFGPPLVGAAIGLGLGRARSPLGLTIIASSVGGAVGAWLGVVLYRLVMATIFGGRDLLIFAAIWIGSFLLGAIASGLAVSGPRFSAAETVKAGGCGFSAACWLMIVFGVYLYLIASEPNAFMPVDWRVQHVGIVCILGGAGIFLLGLLEKESA